jgi:hypothetical protein
MGRSSAAPVQVGDRNEARTAVRVPCCGRDSNRAWTRVKVLEIRVNSQIHSASRIIAPIATTRLRLSSSSLMLSFSPIEYPVRDALQTQIGHLSSLVTWATAIVAVGVALEGVELVHDARVWIKKRRIRKKELADLREVAEIVPVSAATVKTERMIVEHPRWVTVLGRIGLIGVVIGVVAESGYGAKLEDAHNALHAFDMALLTATQREAGNAATSAKTAHDEADAVGQEADAIQKRLDSASRQLSEVESQVRIQDPRRKLLADNRDKFLEALKPFAGQRVTVVKCGYALQAEPERLEQYLLNLLGVSKASKPNAGRVVESPGYTTWAKCNTGASAVDGNLVIVSSTADGTVKAAATALNDALNRIDISTVQTESAPEGRQLELQFLGDDSPWELALKDPTAVIIPIGTNPMFDLSEWHKRHK